MISALFLIRGETMNNYKILLISSFIALVSNNCWAKPVWLKAIGDAKKIQSIQAVETTAAVKVSDGMKYKTKSSWQSEDYVVFYLEYPDSKTILGKEGLYYWNGNGDIQKNANEELRDFIFGHQFHAELLFTKKFVTSFSEDKNLSAHCKCHVFNAIDLEGNDVEYHTDKSSSKLKLKIVDNKKHGKIKTSYAGWEKINGIKLPTKILINHDGRNFSYKFNNINFNTNSIYQSLRTPYNKLTDEQKIRRLH